MRRREFIAAAAAGVTLGVARPGSASAADEASIRQLIVKSEITNKKRTPQNEAGQWLESAILRRSAKRWRIALIHSTQITKPGS
jgi:hypothetical protein